MLYEICVRQDVLILKIALLAFKTVQIQLNVKQIKNLVVPIVFCYKEVNDKFMSKTDSQIEFGEFFQFMSLIQFWPQFYFNFYKYGDD